MVIDQNNHSFAHRIDKMELVPWYLILKTRKQKTQDRKLNLDNTSFWYIDITCLIKRLPPIPMLWINKKNCICEYIYQISANDYQNWQEGWRQSLAKNMIIILSFFQNRCLSLGFIINYFNFMIIRFCEREQNFANVK